VAVGAVSQEQQKVYQTVWQAKNAAMAGIKAGEKCQTIDKIARDFIDNAGYQGCFGHGLGHSVGLDIHESPCFNTRDDTLLQSGMVLTVEPGIYLENRFGVRIEDMVAVTETGYRNLTKSPDELIIL
jgi:Xaa-Pro aminopeptidase